MIQPSQQPAGDMVWLVARYPSRPGDLMKLGSILTDPANPETSLNLDSIEDPPKIMDASAGIRSSVECSLSRDNSALLKAAATVPILTGIAAGLAVEGRWKHDATTTVHCMGVKASMFIPEDDYMKRALQNPKVAGYVQKGLFSKRLFVIVGVATAKKLCMRETMTHQKTAGASVSADAPAFAGGAVEANYGATASFNTELDVGEEVDFAYRVRQFSYHKMLGLRSKGDYIEKSMFRAGGYAYDDDDDDDEPEFVPRFGSLEPSDAAPAKLVGLVADI